ncbi:MAG: cytochrome c [Pseudomonadales bacterium]
MLLIFCAVTCPAFAAGDDDQSTLGQHLVQKLGQVDNGYTGSIVSPDGSGLPDGTGSVKEGKALYNIQCIACHGVDGHRKGNELVGGIGTLASPSPKKTVGSFWPYATTLYDYIARAMPYNQEKSLSSNEVYSVTAYVLYLNGILEGEASVNRGSLPRIAMPNRNGFVELTEFAE